jgi:hypothetical protein
MSDNPTKATATLIAISFLIMGIGIGHAAPASLPQRLHLPEYFKDARCNQTYDSLSGKPDGWMLNRGHIYLSSAEGSCADFYRLFEEQPSAIQKARSP